MSDPTLPNTGAGGGEFTGTTREEMHSALFAQMVMQQSNLALMLLGKVAHPETGQTVRDLEAARFFIDQLEMLEAKTKGNLSSPETALLKQTLMSLRLAFVEAVNAPPEPPPASAKAATTPTGEDSPAAVTENKTEPAETPDAVNEEESRKRFSKKY